MSYNDDVRAALDPRGFNIVSLRRVTRLSFEAIDDGHAAHPVVPFVIAMVCTKVTSDWEGEPIDADAARLVETHIGPKFLALLDASAQDLTRKLDDLVRAYVETQGLP